MIHEMKLHAEPFAKIRDGKKTVELRLFDEKRRKIDIGDVIVFTNISNGAKISSKVKALYRYASFAELFEELSLEQCDSGNSETVDEAITNMRKYYSAEQEAQYGVLGIRLDHIESLS